ncbi:hypothetical protein BS47DRAFT_1344415 [Hydnum rufescens UP504]|uniref:Uncharacterized protein n=1 Tax=Hydnum rufescens UP504 TaxID=1448309 RepID=A0A9P6AYX1_9AGAM|nr:hypothetical protein BS47DRAFT_1344415 [Hydnum rufescens UP504]
MCEWPLACGIPSLVSGQALAQKYQVADYSSHGIEILLGRNNDEIGSRGPMPRNVTISARISRLVFLPASL